ncbi:MAG: ion transporter [Spirochaetota bacterium]
MGKKTKSNIILKILERFINLVIFVSILQILLEDIAILKGFDNKFKIILMLIGFGIDLIFSIEFIVRSILAGKDRGFIGYFFYQYGWIDFLCSIPLLLMNSLPSFILFLTTKTLYKSTIGFIKIIRIIRAIRITRILRILRVLKILKNLQNASSKMAQNHLSQILIIFIFTLLISLIGYSFISDFSVNKMVEKQIETYQFALMGYNMIINDLHTNSKYEQLDELLSKIKNTFLVDPKILSVELVNLPNQFKLKDNLLYKISDFDNLVNNFSSTDLDVGFFKLKISTQYYENLRISIELLIFVSIILGSILYIFIYLKNFVSRISDVIYVIFKGIKHKDYFLMVRIPENYKDEEIFEFAKFYNDVYLPAKRKQYQKTEEKSKISIDDLMNLDL